MALSFFSSGITCAKAILEASSMQTWTNSQPRPSPRPRRLLWPRRSPVMRWPMPSILPSFLESMWISSQAFLVAPDCQGGVESLEPAEPDPAQRLADRRDRPAEAARDRRPRQPLAPQDCDLGFGGGIEPERAGMRPRRAVAQAGSTFHPEAVAPLAHRPAVDTERRRHGRDRRARLKTFHDQHSTARRGSGILMNVHPRLLADRRVCGNRNLASKPRTDNLHSNDS